MAEKSASKNARTASKAKGRQSMYKDQAVKLVKMIYFLPTAPNTPKRMNVIATLDGKALYTPSGEPLRWNKSFITYS